MHNDKLIGDKVSIEYSFGYDGTYTQIIIRLDTYMPEEFTRAVCELSAGAIARLFSGIPVQPDSNLPSS